MRRYSLSPNARFVVGKEFGVVLDVSVGKYYSLTSSAALIMRGIGAGATPDQVVDDLIQVYDVPRCRLERDLYTFLDLLEARKLCNVAT